MDRAEAIYHGALGLPIAARLGRRMTFFTLGNHHDFAISAVDPASPDAIKDGPGLAHVAFKIGTSLEELRVAKAGLEALGVTVDHASDHTVSKSLVCISAIPTGTASSSTSTSQTSGRPTHRP